MMQGLPRVAKNDPTLAHALAGRLVQDVKEHQLRAMYRERERYGKTSKFKAIKRAFGDDFLTAHVIRPNGERADWSIYGLFAGTDCVFIDGISRTRTGGIKSGHLVMFSKHAVARAAQRTIGEVSWESMRKLIKPYAVGLLNVPELLSEMAARASFRQVVIISNSGAFLGVLERGVLTFRTYVDRSQFHEQQISMLPKEGSDIAIYWDERPL